MREALYASNEDLLHQLATLQRLFGDAKIPPELSGYRSDIEGVCERLRRQVQRNLKDLSYDLPDTFENILRQTQNVMRELELVNSHYAGPILRSLSEDRLALVILRWLHDEHPKARDWPFGLSDGNFAIYPHLDLPSFFSCPGPGSEPCSTSRSCFMNSVISFTRCINRKWMIWSVSSSRWSLTC